MAHNIEITARSGGDSWADRPLVLLVDDNPAKLFSIETVLCELELELVTATSPREALKQLLHRDFAVILLDVSMPEMDGFELASLIRQRPRFETTPIIFVTAIGTSEAERARGYNIGAVDYLLMPIIPEILRAKVSALVELNRKTKQVQRQAEALAILNGQMSAQLQRIELLNRELALSNRELEAFTYSVSHDLRSPLRTVASFCGLLRAECAGSLSGKGQKYLDFMESGLNRAESLIQGFLNLTRVTQAPMRMRSVDLVSLAQSLLPELGVNPRTEFIFPEEIEVQGDPDLLSMALSNLLSNAVKFTAQVETPSIELGVKLDASGQKVYFIKDNGAGFPPEYADRLFIPFQRLHSTEEFSGTGIGLATVQRVISRHGGSLRAEGVSNVGATFFFTLAEHQHASTSLLADTGVQEIKQPG